MRKDWHFYGRNDELADIQRIIERDRWFFCAVSGRRRIGKTTLIQRAAQESGKPHFYFQVPDSDERGVVQAFEESIEDFLAAEGMAPKDALAFSREIKSFLDIAVMISRMCKFGLIVVIDEFQYFHRKALFPFTSFLQREVDKMRDTKNGGLFVLGSIHTEMTAILEDKVSPLFNRVTDRIELGHWDFETLFEVFDAHGVARPEDHLFLWTLFEGVPKFYRDAYDQGVFKEPKKLRKTALKNLFFEGSSPLRDEADNWFLRELQGRYDSVLRTLANLGAGDHSRLRAEYARTGEHAEKELGGYLKILIEKYRMVEKLAPVFSGKTSRKGRYHITDNFLLAWMKAVARNVRLARTQPVEIAVDRADEMLKTVEGFAFEKMVRQMMEEASRKGAGDFSMTDIVRGYWNKADRTDIEIDVVALNEDEKRVRLGSCKRSAARHNADELTGFESHIARFLKTKEGRKIAEWDMEKALYAPAFNAKQRKHLESRGYICRDINDYRRRLYTGG
ncbi:MAG: ATP-binding protein [Rhodospirillales bacterium]